MYWGLLSVITHFVLTVSNQRGIVVKVAASVLLTSGSPVCAHGIVELDLGRAHGKRAIHAGSTIAADGTLAGDSRVDLAEKRAGSVNETSDEHWVAGSGGDHMACQRVVIDTCTRLLVWRWGKVRAGKKCVRLCRACEFRRSHAAHCRRVGTLGGVELSREARKVGVGRNTNVRQLLVRDSRLTVVGHVDQGVGSVVGRKVGECNATREDLRHRVRVEHRHLGPVSRRRGNATKLGHVDRHSEVLEVGHDIVPGRGSV